jgi:ribosomal-protein-alanine N-acetyltransferase
MRPIPLKKTDFYRTIDEVVPGGNFDKGGIVSPQRKIYLQKISMEGLNGMYEYSKDPLMYQYLERVSPPQSISEMEQYLTIFLNQIGKKVMGRTRMMWFVKKVVDEKIIGTVSILNIDYERQMTDWSFGLGPAYWGKGYSFEMLEVLK